MKMIFLVDGDNNINEGLTGIDMLSEEDGWTLQSSPRNNLWKIFCFISETLKTLCSCDPTKIMEIL